MKKIILLLIIFICSFVPAMAEESIPNVVIEKMTDVYKFVPAKNGEGLGKVEHTSEIIFRANRASDVGVAMAYYNDNITIDKVSADSKQYGSYMGDAFFSDSKACLMATELKKPGSKGKVSYRRTFTKPEFFDKIFLTEIYRVENGTISFEIPEPLASRYSITEKNINPKYATRTEEHKDGKLVVTYTLKDMPEINVTEGAPSINIIGPQLHITGHFKDVDDLYRYLRSYTTDKDPGAASVTEKALELTAGCKTDAERIAAITDYVHRTVRYVAVEHGEFGQRPDLPSEVLRKAYGDCKGSAALIKALLRATGIDARLTWVGTDKIAERWTDEPNIATGNHMITAVMAGDSILFIDGTAKYNPAGTLPTGIQGRQAMVEDDAEKCIIAVIPAYPPQTNMRSDSLTVSIDQSGELEAEGSITLTGAYMRAYLSALADTPPARKNEKYVSMFDTALPGSRTSDVTFHQTDDKVTLNGKSRLNGAVKRAGDEIYVTLNPDPNITSLTFKTEKREVDGLLAMRMVIEAVMTLQVPENMSISDLPATVSIDNNRVEGMISTEASADGRSVVRRYRLTVKDTTVPLGEMERYNSDIRRLNRGCTAKIVLKSK